MFSGVPKCRNFTVKQILQGQVFLLLEFVRWALIKTWIMEMVRTVSLKGSNGTHNVYFEKKLETNSVFQHKILFLQL